MTQARTSAAPPSRLKMPVDLILFGAIFALIVIGLWMVFGTTYFKNIDQGGNAYSDVKTQALGAVLGTFALVVMMRFDYWKLKKVAVPLMFVGIVLLLCVWYRPLMPHVSKTEVHRWIMLRGFSFQPSEAAKILLLLYLAAVLSRSHTHVRNFQEGFLPPMLIAGAFLLLIEREPDLGTAVVLFLAVLTLFFMAGAKWEHLALVVAVAGLFVLLVGFGFGHRGGRIATFFNPDSDKQGLGYQINQSRLAIGSGGWLGAGLGQGRQKYYLPESESDFIFATVAEEFGFVRTLPIIGLLLVVGWRGFRIALETKDRFGSLLAGGIAALISWQALVNIGVTMHCLPATGVPLPFISKGATSLIFLMAGVGILLNIAQYPTPPGQAVEPKKRRRN